MITGAEMQRRALGVLTSLERRIRSGVATEAERSRYQAGLSHVLAYEWAQADRPAAELVPPPPVLPEAAQFVEWYERSRLRSPWRATDMETALLWWWCGRPGRGALPDEVLDQAEELLEWRGRRKAA